MYFQNFQYIHHFTRRSGNRLFHFVDLGRRQAEVMEQTFYRNDL